MSTKTIYQIIGLGYGDEGKGSVTDFLTEELKAGFVVRYNGGPQAAHHVINPHTPEKVHCFAQFGAGTFVPRVGTYLSSQMYIDPFAMGMEADMLMVYGYPDARYRLYIDSECPVVTLYHKFLSRVKEAMRGTGRHSSTGMGVGEAVRHHYKLRVHHLEDTSLLTLKLMELEQECLQYIESLEDVNREAQEVIDWFHKLKHSHDYRNDLGCWYEDWEAQIKTPKQMKAILHDHTPSAVFEGAQGVLLDPRYGFQPHVTKTDCTGRNAKLVTDQFYRECQVKRIGVIRCYMTRHGNGPLVTESNELLDLREPQNKENQWQGKFRRGYLDMVALKYAIEISNVDGLFVTCLDQMYGRELKVCESYAYSGDSPNLKDFFKLDGEIIGKPCVNGIKTLEEGCEERTKILKKCSPVLQRHFQNVGHTSELHEFFDYLKEVTGVPVIGYSDGPGRSSKHLRTS